MDAAQLVIFIGLLIFVSHLFAGIFEKKGIPDVLMLMIIGIILGPVLGIVWYCNGDFYDDHPRFYSVSRRTRSAF